jgi:hypothetical protein
MHDCSTEMALPPSGKEEWLGLTAKGNSRQVGFCADGSDGKSKEAGHYSGLSDKQHT